MSKGPWKKNQPRYKPEPTGYQNNVAHWQDTHAASRAKARAATDAVRDRAIADLTKRSRADARAADAKTFIGRPCDRHANAERYTIDGKCVLCVQEYNNARRGVVRAPVKLRVNRIRIAVIGRERPKHQTTAAPVLELDAAE
jgi:hypothetical protein